MAVNQGAIPVKVFIRSRPFNDRENAEKAVPCVTFYKENNQIEIAKKMFAFDSVMDPSTSQKTAFEVTTNSLIEKIMKGFNCTVLAYGQTGSGKTYTMGTEESTDSITKETRGIIPRLVEQIFEAIRKSESPAAYQVYVSMLEIYDEKVNDLLSSAKDLQVRELEGSVIVQGLTRNIVKDLAATMRQLETGCSLRRYGETAMNAKSSRSHAIFTISVDKTAMNDLDNAFKAKLHLVDLAGSERLKKTQAEGERMREGIRINEGLLALGNVISALSEASNGPKHIPYRDSKITRLLQDSLGGNSFTVMIACISPADTNAEETLNTLRYADRAKKIKNKPVVNEDVGQAALIKQQSERIRQLEKQLAERGDGYAPDEELDKRILESMQREKVEWKKKEVKLTYEKSTLKENNSKLLETLKETRDKMLHIVGGSENYEEVVRQINEYVKTFEIDGAENVELDIIEEDNDDEENEEYVAKQSELDNEIMNIGNQIKTRDNDMEKTRLNYEVLKKYDEERKELDSKVEALQHERDKLMNELKKTSTTGKLAEERRQKVRELEGKIAEYRKQLNDYKKLEKKKEECEQKMKKMDAEIVELKKARVVLQKTVKEENEKFRTQKIKSEREMNQLKAKERKREIAHGREKQAQAKKLEVMRQKLEESQRALKRYNTTQIKKTSFSEATLANMKKMLKQDVTHYLAFMDTKKCIDSLQEQKNAMTKHIIANNKKIEKIRSEIASRPELDEQRDELENIEKENDTYQVEIDKADARLKDLIDKQGEYDEAAAADERFKTVDTVDQAKRVLKVLFEMLCESTEHANVQTSRLSDETRLNNQLKSKIHSKDVRNNAKYDEFSIRIEGYREQTITEHSIFAGKLAEVASKEGIFELAQEFYEMRDKLNEMADKIEVDIEAEMPKRKSKQTKFFGNVLNSEANIAGTPDQRYKPRKTYSIEEPLNTTITISRNESKENDLNSTFVKNSPKRLVDETAGEAPPLKIRQKLDRTLGGIP